VERHWRSAVAAILAFGMTASIGAQGMDASDWMRVRELAPGTAILVTTAGSEEVTRYIIATDDSSMMVLNLAAVAPEVRDVLSRFAGSHPEYLSDPNNQTFVFEKNVRIGLDRITERIARASVIAVKKPGTERSAVGCSIAAHYGGAVIGGLPGAIIGGAAGKDTGPALTGMLVGWAVGSVYVYRRCKHTPEKLIYGVP